MVGEKSSFADENEKAPNVVQGFFCDPAGARTQDPNIKSVVLYLLSYRVNRYCDLRLQNYTFFFN